MFIHEKHTYVDKCGWGADSDQGTRDHKTVTVRLTKPQKSMVIFFKKI